MNFPTQAEQKLYDALPPDKRADVEKHYALIAEKPNSCMICGRAIAEDDLFCDDDCKDAWWGIDRAQIEREKTAGQREDAEEHRRELLRDHADRLRDEAIELMTQGEPVLDDDRLRDQEQDR